MLCFFSQEFGTFQQTEFFTSIQSFAFGCGFLLDYFKSTRRLGSSAFRLQLLIIFLFLFWAIFRRLWSRCLSGFWSKSCVKSNFCAKKEVLRTRNNLHDSKLLFTLTTYYAMLSITNFKLLFHIPSIFVTISALLTTLHLIWLF